MSSNTAEQQLDAKYNEFLRYFKMIMDNLQLLIKRVPDNRIRTFAKLIEAVYNAKDCTQIQWRLLEDHWTFRTRSPPQITNEQLANVQSYFREMKTIGENYAEIFKSAYQTEDLSYEWLESSGWSKTIKLIIFTYPLTILHIQPEYMDKPLEWKLLLTVGREAKLNMFDVISEMCSISFVEFGYDLGFEDQFSLNCIKELLDQIDLLPESCRTETRTTLDYVARKIGLS